MKNKFAEAQRLGGGRGGGLGPAQNAGDSKRKFAWLERLGDVIVGADLKSGDPALSRVPRRQHQDRHCGGLANVAGKVEPVLPPAS